MHAALNYKTEKEHARNSFGFLPHCERKTLNLEKTTSSVLSVLLLLYVNNKLYRVTVDKFRDRKVLDYSLWLRGLKLISVCDYGAWNWFLFVITEFKIDFCLWLRGFKLNSVCDYIFKLKLVDTSFEFNHGVWVLIGITVCNNGLRSALLICDYCCSFYFSFLFGFLT